MGGQEADGVVHLGACVYDALGMMREAREVNAVLLALELLCMPALLAVVYLERIVIAGNDGKLARIVEVEGRDGRAGVGAFEALDGTVSFYLVGEEKLEARSSKLQGGEGRTREGRKVVMTSLTFCVTAPPGGWGTPGVEEPVAMTDVGDGYLASAADPDRQHGASSSNRACPPRSCRSQNSEAGSLDPAARLGTWKLAPESAIDYSGLFRKFGRSLLHQHFSHASAPRADHYPQYPLYEFAIVPTR